jgi:PTH1 family peptidyl-tRNA hydrolase
MWVVAGLGNPGPEHAGQRHNVGFMVADAIAADTHAPAFRQAFSSHITETRIADQKVWLLKPMTYMNRSGKAVGEVMRYYDIPSERVLVIHDELDLVFGKVRIKKGGGHGGHNGLRDIDAHIGKDYWRMRVGIGHPGHKDQVHGYVLHDFSKAEREFVSQLNDIIARELPLFFKESPESLMTKIALRCPPPSEDE